MGWELEETLAFWRDTGFLEVSCKFLKCCVAQLGWQPFVASQPEGLPMKTFLIGTP